MFYGLKQNVFHTIYERQEAWKEISSPECFMELSKVSSYSFHWIGCNWLFCYRIPCEVKAERNLSAEGYDGIILVTDALTKLASGFETLATALKSQAEFGMYS